MKRKSFKPSTGRGITNTIFLNLLGSFSISTPIERSAPDQTFSTDQRSETSSKLPKEWKVAVTSSGVDVTALYQVSIPSGLNFDGGRVEKAKIHTSVQCFIAFVIYITVPIFLPVGTRIYGEAV